MPNGQAIVNGVLSRLGILEQGGVPSLSDSNYVLSELNTMWNAWSIDDGLVWAIQATTENGLLPLTGGGNGYAIGPGGFWNVTTLPTRIHKATLQIAIGGGYQRRELRIVGAQEYFAHNDLAAASNAAEEFYCNYEQDAVGHYYCYFWPVPTCPVATYIDLEISVPFKTWDLVTVYAIQPGYQDAIEWALAFRCLAAFGVAVSQEVAQVCATEAVKSEARLRKINATLRVMPEMPPPGTPAAAPTPPRTA